MLGRYKTQNMNNAQPKGSPKECDEVQWFQCQATYKTIQNYESSCLSRPGEGIKMHNFRIII